ncbi:tRNA (5-methylaminomethyl-2-thiouridylate)-methyltransferase [Ectothiorhodospiraceae bacterium BW-2]|nr:tRNA (5-methylaminomethyl-2-thiouridylate)-methyltransferase [Ectothiorhodospiraceae bacterium BW-2]
MPDSSPQRRAVALISGGLDSMLAAKVIMAQGIHVEGINFYTGFCVEGHTHAIRKQATDRPKRNNALWSAEQLGIKLHIIDIIEPYKEVLLNPKHGYGAHLNPCLDCKVFMVSKALEWAKKHRFDFIITGEVIGQRPMSQLKEKLPIIARESGAEDRLVRPLCAQNLPPTLPEREGWLDRERLYNFSGRSRKPQIALAKAFNLNDWAAPAGGCCFLTDATYSRKLADLWQARDSRHYEMDDIMLLKVGRHLRPAPHYKLIIGREEGENNFLCGYKRQFIWLNAVSHKGPLALIDGAPQLDDLTLAARILARYGQGRHAERVTVDYTLPSGESGSLQVSPLKSDQIPTDWML